MENKVKPLYISFACGLCLGACGPFMPEIAKSIEDIATDDAVKVVITKEAIQKETNLDVSITVQNREDAHP